MPILLQRLFPTPEVKIVLCAYRDEIKRISTVKANSVLGPVAGIELLNEEVKNAIHAGKDTVKQKIAAGKAPRVLVLLIISNLAYRHVASGQYHSYRGRLSMKGNSLHSLWHYTMDELEKAGELSTEDRRLADLDLRQEIKEVG